jgi:hypothetical protein
MTPPHDLAALAKAWVDAACDYEMCSDNYAQQAGIALDAAEAAFTSALAAQQAHIAAPAPPGWVPMADWERQFVRSLQNVSDAGLKITQSEARMLLAILQPRAMIASAATPGTPAAGVWVPAEPTSEMLSEGWKHVTSQLEDGRTSALRDLYRAMIAAKP